MQADPATMNTRDQEAAALKRLWNAHKKKHPDATQEQLGRRHKIGNQSMVSQYLHGRAKLDLQAALKFAAAFGCAVADFSPRLANEAARAAQRDPNDPGVSLIPEDLFSGGSLSEPVPMHPVRKIQVTATGKMLSEDQVELLVGAGGYVYASTTDPEAYAIVMKGDEGYPAIRHGWVLVIEPNVQPTPGEFIFLKLRDGRDLVVELLMRTEDSITVMAANGTKRTTHDLGEVEAILAIGAQVPPSHIRKE
jgi:transcriptional regulator with XRE-family HTH domain